MTAVETTHYENLEKIIIINISIIRLLLLKVLKVNLLPRTSAVKYLKKINK